MSNAVPARPAALPQTNLQLYRLMIEMGYQPDDIVRVTHGYGLAMQLFSGRYRACGKPFVCHLVGTAAVLAWLRAPVTSVVCGLLHAAYAEGDFGSASHGMTPMKRERLRRVVGDEAESLIVDYTTSSRTATALVAAHASFASLSPRRREILVVQLANELDDFRDWAPHFARNADNRLDGLRMSRSQQIEMAQSLGYPALAAALRETYDDCLASPAIPSALRSNEANGYTLVPASAGTRLPVRVMGIARRVLRRLRRS